ncbi:MAG: DUF3987 domain-containing protein [Salinivirgaceae bacterium]|nr:DUF3987 domain-containing protein [Salinivirgaceae bacterium]
MIQQSAASIGCPVEYSLVGFISSMSIIVGNAYKLQIKRNYSVKGIVYITLIAPPGGKKSPALNMLIEPIRKYQKRLYEEYKQQIAEDDESEKELQLLVVTDSTTEAINETLKNNKHGLLVYKDEMASLMKSFNMYKSGGGDDLEKYLEFWNGGMVVISRKSAKIPTIIDSTFVTIVGGIQPSVIKGLSNFSNNGFQERFCFFMPDPSQNKYSKFEMDEEVMKNYSDLCVALLSKYNNISNEEGTRTIQFSEEAQELWHSEAAKLSDEMHDSTPIYLQAYWSKLESYLGRFALLLELLQEKYIKEDCMEVSAESLSKALMLIEILKIEARKVWKLFDENPDHEKDMAKVKDWIKANEINGFIARRDALNAKLLGSKTTKDVDSIFETLELEGFGKQGTAALITGRKIIGFARKGTNAYNRIS